MAKEIKSIHHADDLTLALKDSMCLQSALGTISDFRLHAGSKINLNKTVCILPVRLKANYNEKHGIKVVKKTLRCLGIYIGHDKKDRFNKN